MRFLSSVFLLASAVVAMGHGNHAKDRANAIHPKAVSALVQALGAQAPRSARGVVFHDVNTNGKRDPNEPGVPGVMVTDQNQIVRTGRDGTWQMPAEPDEDTAYFVVKPRGWMVPLDEFNKPQFYYIHKKNGSPASLRFPGVPPTGSLPESIDFPLVRQEERDRFQAFFFGDTQPRNVTEVDYIRRDVIEPMLGKHQGVAFGVTLGDVVFDDLSVFEPLARVTAMLGVPWWHVIGNHDINFDVPTDDLSDEAWERFYGPNFYAFQWGRTHFIALDNVHWTRPDAAARGNYVSRLGDAQIAWVAKYLNEIPKDELVVLMMHIPITATEDRQELFALIQNRPPTVSVSAHTHFHNDLFLKEMHGWRGENHHHHMNIVTICGSWWQGAPDEAGIPHSTMRDGGPNGYTLYTFDRNAKYSYRLFPARRPDNYQMAIHAPDRLEQAKVIGTEVLVNVFTGNERSKVEMSFDGGAWQTLAMKAVRDPDYVKVFERDRALVAPFRPLPGPIDVPHMWVGTLPAARRKGLLLINVRTTDMFGQSWTDTRAIRVE